MNAGRFLLLAAMAGAAGGWACRISYQLGRLRGRSEAEADLASTLRAEQRQAPRAGWLNPPGPTIDLTRDAEGEAHEARQR